MNTPEIPPDLPDEYEVGETKADHSPTWIAGVVLSLVTAIAALLLLLLA